MKKIITFFSFILAITSCDIVEGPYLIDDGGITPVDTSSDAYVKKILIEDFTGHTCSNCPNAARELEAIQDFYGAQIIGMALHVSGFAAPHIGSGKYEYDFRTQWGDSWSDFFGISALPRGMVNRIGYPNEHKLGKDEWADAVITELEKEIDFGINITSDINGTITINTELLNDLNGDYKLVVCLTESNIINWQTDKQSNPEDVEFYEHNHALRTVLLDENLSASSIYTIGDEITTVINFDLIALEQSNNDYSHVGGVGNVVKWDSLNIAIIAYIYDNTTQEILQVQEAHLTN